MSGVVLMFYNTSIAYDTGMFYAATRRVVLCLLFCVLGGNYCRGTGQFVGDCLDRLRTYMQCDLWSALSREQGCYQNDWLIVEWSHPLKSKVSFSL